MVNRNHIFCYGSPTSAKTVINLNMVSDLIEQFRETFDKKALHVAFPDVLYALQEKNQGMHITTGDHLQKMFLSLRNRSVTYSRAIIFADSENEMIDTAKKIFDQVLSFQKTEVCCDCTKAEVIDKLASLHEEA